MIILFYSILFLSTVLQPETWQLSLDNRNGMSYIEAAEDISASSQLTNKDKKLAIELYVLAAVIDPMYRDSAIHGIISVVMDDELIIQLRNMLHSHNALAPFLLMNNQEHMKSRNDETIQSICTSLAMMRQGKTIDGDQADFLSAYKYMFTSDFDIFFQDKLRRRKQLSDEEIDVTLKVELEVLGGPSLWSADYASSGGQSVVVNSSDDLASLLSVDPTKTIRKDGIWVIK